MRNILAALLLLVISISRVTAQPVPLVVGSGISLGTDNLLFWANTSGACVWNTSNDVGPCINDAIAKAVAAGGGTVTIPAGVFNVATPIVQGHSGVHMVGAGVGAVQDNSSPSAFLSITRLVWTGAAGGTLFDEEPSGTATIWSVDVQGIVFDCASLANICAKFASVSGSFIDIGVSEPRVTGAWLTTQPSLVDAPGTQQNDIWIRSRSTSSSYSPTGILIDGGQGSNFNVSGNRFWFLDAVYHFGDGIVLGNNDSNQFYTVTYSPWSGATGSPFVIAAPGYVMPSGGSISTPAQGSNDIFYTDLAPTTVQGAFVSSTLTPGANSGTAALTPVTLVTNAPTSGGALMNYASTSGVASWMTFSCGGPVSHVPNFDAVFQTTATTIRPIYLLGNPASGLSCTFTWGLTPLAVQGTYTITATGASTYNITAPSGGHSQTGVSVSGGALTFTDLVMPITGSAVSGDTFTVVVGGAPYAMNIQGVSSINGTPLPYFAPLSDGSYSTVENPYPAVASAKNGILIPFASSACGNFGAFTSFLSVVLGDCSGGSTGAYNGIVGGSGNSTTGFAGGVVGGQDVSLSGFYTRGGGFNVTDRSGWGADVWGSGAFATNGDAEARKMVLRGTTSSTSAVRLTANAGAAGSTSSGSGFANCVNALINSAFAVNIQIIAFDYTTPANNEAWLDWSGLLAEGINPSATTLAMKSTPTPLTNGTVTGSSVSATADTTNACINLSFTPPSGNTDTWNVVARVETVEATK